MPNRREAIHSSAVLHRLLLAALMTNLAVALSVWAHPALAMPAGFCDDRAASAIAPAPALQPPNQVLRQAPASCADELPALASIAPAHRVIVRSSAEAPPALLPVCPTLPSAQSSRLELAFALVSPAHGVRWRVERPPRR